MEATKVVAQFTAQIEAGDETGSVWQVLSPAETATGTSAESVAASIRDNQTVTEPASYWRICVWDGLDADLGAPPSYVLSNACVVCGELTDETVPGMLGSRRGVICVTCQIWADGNVVTA